MPASNGGEDIVSWVWLAEQLQGASWRMQRRTSGEEVDLTVVGITSIMVATVEVVSMVAATMAEEVEGGKGGW